jgi:hypothetical protein
VYIASSASGQGPSGFSLALILTASGGMGPIIDNCAIACSLKKGNAAAPAPSMVEMRPKLRREYPRRMKSRFISSVTIWDI